MDARDLFETLVRENADMLTAFIRATVRDHSLADDVFQETMLTAWRRLDEYDKQRPFGSWLRGIAARVQLAVYRKAKRGFASCDEETLEYLAARFATLDRQPGDTFEEKLECLRDCVERLPDEYREPIQLYYASSGSAGTTADTLGLSVETIKKRLQRARARLLDCMHRKLAVT